MGFRKTFPPKMFFLYCYFLTEVTFSITVYVCVYKSGFRATLVYCAFQDYDACYPFHFREENPSNFFLFVSFYF